MLMCKGSSAICGAIAGFGHSPVQTTARREVERVKKFLQKIIRQRTKSPSAPDRLAGAWSPWRHLKVSARQHPLMPWAIASRPAVEIEFERCIAGTRSNKADENGSRAVGATEALHPSLAKPAG